MSDQTSRTPRTDTARASCRSLDDLYGCQPLERLCLYLEIELAAAQKKIKELCESNRALELEAADLRKRETMRLAGISTAAFGYWKKGDSIHPDYVTTALHDVADLYAKYADLRERLAKAEAAQPQQGPMAHLDLAERIAKKIAPAIRGCDTDTVRQAIRSGILEALQSAPQPVDGMVVPRDLAERTFAMFDSVDKQGGLTIAWLEVLASAKEQK